MKHNAHNCMNAVMHKNERSFSGNRDNVTLKAGKGHSIAEIWYGCEMLYHLALAHQSNVTI